jgi:hypothetical protein
MRNTRMSTMLMLAAIVAVSVGCSSAPSTGGLFGDNSACAPPVAQTPCDPPVVDCAPPVCEPVVAQQGQRPPDARAGEVWCYVRVPAVMRTEEDRVCVRQASCRQIPIPAEYEDRCDQVCTKQASCRQIPIPAEYEDRCDQICVGPARTEWQKVNCNPTQLAPKEQVGECWTLVEIPAQFQTRTTRVCTKPETFRTEQIPAEFESRTTRVCTKQECFRTEQIPAEFETRYREVQTCGPRWEWRRTTECEVPEEAAGAPLDNVPAPYEQPAPLPAGSPDADLPPAGALPPLR